MRPHLALICLALSLLPDGGLAQRAPARAGVAGCGPAQTEDVIKAVSERGELALASGKALMLRDIRLPLDDESGPSLSWLRSLIGRRVSVAVADKADRWGRHAGDVALLDETAPIDVAGLLVDEGFAIVDAGVADALCRPDFLAREQQARARRLGIWRGERHRPVAAHDLARLKGSIGRFALVEGVVRSVGERRERTYLNFGGDWKDDLTITIPKRTWAVLRERGLSADALRGRRVRARGVLDEWQGVALEITAADMLEVPGQDITRP